MTATQKFDIVLNCFYNQENQNTYSLTIPQVYSSANEGLDNTTGLISYSEITAYVLELRIKGFLTDNNHIVLESRTFFITPNGSELILNGGYNSYLKKQAEKEKLEDSILKATHNSFKLNKLQFLITVILAVGTLAALIIQFLMYRSDIEKNGLEIEKLKNEINQFTPPHN
jgi:hypothetical protein